MCDSPFIIKLFACYVDDKYLHFLLEPVLGGELFVLYQEHRLHGSAAHAKYYAAAVSVAFQHLHDRHVIYRDLKPENLMLGARGEIKLVDFGLSKCSIVPTYTTCGTPDYF